MESVFCVPSWIACCFCYFYRNLGIVNSVSLLIQEGVELKVLVRDDGSSDSTWDLLIAYKDLLSEEAVWLISRFVFSRKNWLTRLLLLLDGKIKYNGFESNLFYVLKIIKGGVGLPLFSHRALTPFVVREGL